MCGSLLSLLALLSAASSPPSSSLSSSSFLLSATYYLPVERLSFLLGARREVVTLGSNGLYLGDGNGGRLFTPTGVERVAIPRGEPPWSCKSYEQVIRGGRRKAKESRESWEKEGGGG